MNYLKEQFLKDVKKEATALRKNATDKEKKLLDEALLDGNDIHRCVYGQMTGSCNSKRAATLINQCCIKYFVNPGMVSEFNHGMRTVKKIANGKTVDGFIKERTNEYGVTHMSAIETYILLPKAKTENLISYIKGEKKELVL